MSSKSLQTPYFLIILLFLNLFNQLIKYAHILTINIIKLVKHYFQLLKQL